MLGSVVRYEPYHQRQDWGETHRDQRTLAEGVHPVLVPQHPQQLRVQTGLEDLYLEGVVLIRMDTEIFDLVERDGLVFGGRGGRGLVVLWVGAEGADIDFTSGDGAVWVDLQRNTGWVFAWEGDGRKGNVRLLRRRGLGTFGCWIGCSRRYRRASIRIRDASDTIR